MAKQYSLRNELMMEGSFTSIPDDFTTAREGQFIYYHPNGRMARKGLFANSERTGQWLRFAYTTGTLTAEDQYVRDTLNGPSVQYSSTTGDKWLEGQHERGRREGPWKHYIKGFLNAEWIYTAGKVVQVRYFDAAGHTIKVMSYRDERLTAAHAFDAEGREYAYVPSPSDSVISYYAEERPTPPYDMAKFLDANLRYPATAREKSIEGNVVVKFMVDELGNISNGQVVNSVHPDLDAEALRIVSLLPKWNPALQNGDPVKFWCTMPFIFRMKP